MSFAALSLINVLNAKTPDSAVDKRRLPNGMTVLVQELHTAPVVAVNVWVGAGSVQESDAERGLTHFIEHMLFKGTKTMPVGDLDRRIKAAGGYNNAHTRYESTDFIDVLPSSKLGVGLETMADALQNSTFDAAELDRERKVVLEELSRGQDNPMWEAWNRLTHLAFERHPYRHPIIGYKETVGAQDRALMTAYWGRYYRPANLTLVIVGDVKADEAHRMAAEAFGGWKEGAVRAEEPPREPRQRALRCQEDEADIQTTVLLLGVPAPAELDAEAPALEMAVSILGQGLSSRLNQSVREEKKLAHSVGSGLFNGRHPGLAYLFAELEPGQVKEAAAAMWAEAARMARDGVTDAELERQRARLEFSEARERMNMEGLAGKLGYYESLAGDWREGDRVLDRLRRVTSADVRKAAARFFKPGVANVVLYRPKGSQATGLDAAGWQALLDKAERAAAAEAPAPAAAAAQAPAQPAPGPFVDATSASDAAAHFSRFTLDNGLTLLVKPVRHTPLVCGHLAFKAGVRYEPADKAGAFEMLSMLALKGTRRHDAKQLAAAMDDNAIMLGPHADHDTWGIAVQSLAGRFPRALSVLAEVLTEPAIPAEEFDKERQRLLKDIKDKKDEPDEYVEEVFDKAFFKRSPYARPVEGSAASVKALKVGDLEALRRRYLQPANLVMVLVGDLDPREAAGQVSAALGAKAWPGAPVAAPKVPVESAPSARREKVERLAKKQAHVMLGWLGPTPLDDDYFAWRVANSVLGEGMNSRLFNEVREKRGLCYTTYSTFDRGIDPGAIRIYVGTRPENEATAMKVVMQVVRRFREEGVTQEELASSKAYARGLFEMARQDFANEARLAIQYELWGLGAGMIERFAGRIDAVTLEQVKQVARRRMDPDKPVVAILRP